MNSSVAILACGANMKSCGKAWFALGLLAAVTGCGRAPKTAPQSSVERPASTESASGIRPTPEPAQVVETEKTAIRMPVGDDPAASLTHVAQGVREAVERFDKVEKLIYPRGWHRQRAAVLAVSSEVSPQDPGLAPLAGIVRISVQDRYGLIHATREEAAGDGDLYPRRPFPTREAMLNDRVNPPRDPVELILRYEVRDGTWRRIDWDGPGKFARGADWFDQLQAP